MDFLDPRKRRRHERRLVFGYVLVAVAILLGAYLLVITAGGFGYDRKTGNVIVNGLLFVDSKPGGADIYLNGQPTHSTTSARMILPAGSYQLTIKKTGYLDWTRHFNLDGHEVARYVYPLLLPAKPQIKQLRSFTVQPNIITASPDHHWLLVQLPESPGVDFLQYDTTDLTVPPKTISLPAGLLTASPGPSSLKVAQWSTDNKHLLLQHDFSGGSEFIVFNKDSTSDSLNVNKTLNVSPTNIELRDNKVSQLYLYDAKSQQLQLGDIGRAQVTPLLNHVLAFKSDGPDFITYVTDQDSPAGMVTARIWDGNKSYPFYSFKAGHSYIVDSAGFQGDNYYVAGSDNDNRVNLFKNPLDTIKNPATPKAVPLLSLDILGAQTEAFSANTRFVGVEAGQEFSVYDAETQNFYRYSLHVPLAGPLAWMDGHRFIGDSQGVIFISDYDATNQHLFVPTNLPTGGFFDKDYNHLLTTVAGANGTVLLESIDLRAGVDLPKQ